MSLNRLLLHQTVIYVQNLWNTTSFNLEFVISSNKVTGNGWTFPMSGFLAIAELLTKWISELSVVSSSVGRDQPTRMMLEMSRSAPLCCPIRGSEFLSSVVHLHGRGHFVSVRYNASFIGLNHKHASECLCSQAWLFSDSQDCAVLLCYYVLRLRLSVLARRAFPTLSVVWRDRNLKEHLLSPRIVSSDISLWAGSFHPQSTTIPARSGRHHSKSVWRVVMI